METDSYFRDVSTPAESMSLPDDAVTYAGGTSEDLEQAAKAALAQCVQFLDPDEIVRSLLNYPGLGANLRK